MGDPTKFKHPKSMNQPIVSNVRQHQFRDRHPSKELYVQSMKFGLSDFKHNTSSSMRIKEDGK